jgi:SlyX protein
MLEPRLMEIEIKLTRQEDMLEALNQVVYQQQKQIDELHNLCAALAGHLAQRADQRGDAAPLDERPPHY